MGISGRFMTESGADVVAIEMLELEIDKVGNATPAFLKTAEKRIDWFVYGSSI